MKIAISNIAREKEDNNQVYDLMQKYGCTGLEIAPTKTFDNFLYLSGNEIHDFKHQLSKYGINIIAAQSLLFGHPELKLFTNTKDILKDYMMKIIDFAAQLGIKSLIFGSPKNRIYEGITKKEAIQIAKDFFIDLGEYCYEKGVYLCIEPNPKIYGGNFMCNTLETLEFVKYINHPGIRLHLDLGTIIINNEDINIIADAKSYITHFHISEPYLNVIEEREIHYKIKNLLTGYDGYCGIEMKGTSVENIEKTLILVSNILK